MPDHQQLFRVHASSRLESLATRLADEMRQHPGDPLRAERVIVPHPVLGQWLRLQLADRLGVAAHLRIELPAEFAWTAMREALPWLPEEPIFEPAYLRWRIFERLGRWTGDDEIGRYLGDGEPRKRFELADRLALAYDRCLVYRPEEIRNWQAGEKPAWHARLWSALVADQAPALHWIDAIAAYRDALQSPQDPGTGEARARVSFFGVPTMSPSYLEMLGLAAAVMDINLFLLSPRRDFWTKTPRTNLSGYYHENNELLAAWARPIRDLQALLGQRAGIEPVEDMPRDGPPTDTCLGAVQADILGHAIATEPPGRHTGPDDSVQVHVCHSPTREVEVLHDRLLGLFDAHQDIQPADVLVLTPDLDTYAPVFEAVFGAAGRIRFQVGRQRFKEGAALTAFLDLLDLPGSRYAANATIAPLRAASVRACFGIDEGDLPEIRDWLRRAGIRWGIDADHRTALGVPPSPNHTWRHGLRRLLLGYSITSGDVLIDGITPSGLDPWGESGSASDYERLGRLHRYCEFVFELNDWAATAHAPSAWAGLLRTEVLGRFFAAERRFHPEVGREVSAVARLIDAFATECDTAGATAPITFDVLRDVVAEHAGKTNRAMPRLADGVTVAGLGTGQITPAKIICTVGMNDGAFPSRPPPAPFDFLSRLFADGGRQLGDRDVRDDDRFAFLEAVLAARRCLLVTYTGRDLQEDKPIPPSVVVSELTDHLDRRFPGTTIGGDLARWETRHPLQPFSSRYFQGDEPALFSYSKPMELAAAAVDAPSAAPTRFAQQLDPEEPDIGGGEIDLDEFVRFALSPTKYFLRNRLGMHLDLQDDEMDDDEPFQLNALAAWQLKSDLADFGEPDEDRGKQLAAGSALLPPGNLGDIQYRESGGEVRRLREALRPYTDHCETAEVDVDIDGTRIVGTVGQFHGEQSQLLWWRIGDLRARHILGVWLRLLALSCTRGAPITAHLFGSKHAGKPNRIDGPAPAEARKHLDQWLDAWRDAKSKPLPFFAGTSWEWMKKQCWTNAVGSEWSAMPWSEGNDAYHQLVYPDGPPTEAFEDLAVRLLEPLKESFS